MPNTSLLITDLPAAEPGAMQIERAFPELSFSSPVLMIEMPDESGRLAVVQKNGLIRVFTRAPNPTADDVSTFLDISNRVLDAGEQGLLGLAFDSNYAKINSFMSTIPETAPIPAPRAFRALPMTIRRKIR